MHRKCIDFYVFFAIPCLSFSIVWTITPLNLPFWGPIEPVSTTYSPSFRLGSLWFHESARKRKKILRIFLRKKFLSKNRFFNLLLEVLIRLKRSWCHWKAFAKSNQMLHLTCSKCISFEKYLRKTAARILLSAPVSYVVYWPKVQNFAKRKDLTGKKLRNVLILVLKTASHPGQNTKM